MVSFEWSIVNFWNAFRVCMTFKPGETNFHISKCRVVADVTFLFRLLAENQYQHCYTVQNSPTITCWEVMKIYLYNSVWQFKDMLYISKSSGAVKKPGPLRGLYLLIFFFVFIQTQTFLNIQTFAIILHN